MAVTCSMLLGSPVLGTSLGAILGSLVLLGIIVASGGWFPFPRLVKGILELVRDTIVVSGEWCSVKEHQEE